MAEAEFINVPVVDGSPPDAGKRDVNIVDEYIMPDFITSLTPRVSGDAEKVDIGMTPFTVIKIG